MNRKRGYGILLLCAQFSMDLWTRLWGRYHVPQNVFLVSRMFKLILPYWTSVYPAKGRLGSRTTKLDSGAQKRLIRSPIEGYGSRPQASAIGPCRSRTLGQRASVRANSDRRPLRRPALVARKTFSKSAILCSVFPIFTHLWSKFSGCFYPFTSTYVPMNHEKFHGNRSTRFWEIRKTDTQTDIRGSFMYIDVLVFRCLSS